MQTRSVVVAVEWPSMFSYKTTADMTAAYRVAESGNARSRYAIVLAKIE